MNGTLRVGREQLMRYLTMLHFETVPASGSGVEQVCAHVRARNAVQFDPIDVVGRNADLVLQSRIEGYRPEMLRDAIYTEHRLYDGYDKNLCTYPIEDYPYFGRMRLQIADWFRENPQIREAMPKVLEEIDRRGPLCSEDLDLNEKVRWPWGYTRIARAALESLWMDGKLVITRREGVKKYYDRFERCYDAALMEMPDPNPADGDYFRWQVKRRLESVGLLSGGASDAFLCVEGMKAAQRAEAFRTLEEAGEIVSVSDGTFSGFIPARNVEILQRAEKQHPEDRLRFIAPLDNLIWDRKMIARLFGFEYKWEIYVPAGKRRYGYYVLPVMFGSCFAARMEAEKFDGHTLRIKNWWWEDGWNDGRMPAHALEDSLNRFAGFLGAKAVEYTKV